VSFNDESRRIRVNAEAAASSGPDAPEESGAEASPPDPAGDFAGQADDMKQKLAVLEAEKKGLIETLARRQADFDNFRKRIERERLEDRERVVASVILDFLPVLDDFERALGSKGHEALEEYRKGVDLIYRHLWKALEKHGLKRMQTKGRRFDPHHHHAIERVHTAEYEDGTVIDEMQPGYFLHERILRPALVRVAVHERARVEASEEAGKE
jgi:molecular chaperone GrpE